MFRRFLGQATVAVLLALSAPALAQVPPDPVNEVTRYKVHFYKFGPGGKDKARELIWEHILPAIREAKLPEPIILHPDDGEWDMISMFPLAGGYTDLHFNVSPSELKWQSIALRKGDEKFKALGQSRRVSRAGKQLRCPPTQLKASGVT